MSSNPLVSVLIPAHNHEKYVQETIRSVINQTYDNIELIIIDDGSEDSTWQKINDLKNECEKRFVRVVFESQQNHGTALTQKKLLEKARGKYIALIASDDAYLPQAIEKMAGFLDTNPDYVLAVGDNQIINGHTQIVGWDKQRNSVPFNESLYPTFVSYLKRKGLSVFEDTNNFGSYETLLKENYIPNGYLIKAAAWKKVLDIVSHYKLEDWGLHLQLSKLGRYKYIPEVLFSYRWHNANTITQKSKIKDYARQSILYEESLILSSGDKDLIRAFQKSQEKEKRIVSLFGKIELLRIKDLHHKKIVLHIFDKRWILWQKKL